jgi:hypothetical protein
MIINNNVVVSPLAIPSCKYLYDVSQLVGLNDNDLVASMTDTSGNGNTLTPSAVGLKPVYKTNIINGLPVLRFPNAGFCNLKSTNKAAFDFLHTGESTTFWVIRPTANAADKPLFSSNAAGVTTNVGRYTTIKAGNEFADLVTYGTAGQYVFNLLTANDEMTLNDWHLVVTRHKKGQVYPDSEMYIDNKAPKVTNTANAHSLLTSTADPTFFANSGITTYFEGDVAMWGGYDRYLTNTEINQLIGGAAFG